MTEIRRICGVDFSGAQDAGTKIWVTTGIIQGRFLRIQDCCPASALSGSGKGRTQALVALRELVAGSGNTAFGFDFPFGLPMALVKENDWDVFAYYFSETYPSPEWFKRTCLAAAGGKELKRRTDRESHTPFSPYNLRLYKQTYYGIAGLLAPLVRSGRATVLPMQPIEADKPWVMEICPASTLAAAGRASPSYKGGGQERLMSRCRILDTLEASVPLILPPRLRPTILRNIGGDALDSVVAATAVFHSLPNLPDLGREVFEYAIEGYVYL